MSARMCEVCGADMTGSRNGRYCSRSCYDRRPVEARRWRNLPPRLGCDTCGADLRGRPRRARFCSRECWRRRARPVRLCKAPGCDDPVGRSGGKGYCPRHYSAARRYNGDPFGRVRERRPAPLDGRCTLDACSEPHYAKGYCRVHYHRYWRHGDPRALYRGGTLADRLARYTTWADGCQVWTGALNAGGYGVLRQGGRGRQVMLLAHRVSWELANGQPVPPGLFVLHSCDNRACVNPAHLRPGSQLENMDDVRARGRHGNGARRRRPVVEQLELFDVEDEAA